MNNKIGQKRLYLNPFKVNGLIQGSHCLRCLGLEGPFNFGPIAGEGKIEIVRPKLSPICCCWTSKDSLPQCVLQCYATFLN